jgi:tRNA A-37 threonylcarbamoyl transferase component Bud32
MVAGDSLSGLPSGSRVGGYLLERLIGVGGMAAVYQARDERLDRVVALKVLWGDESLRRRFVREARAVAKVDHPHIIPVYEAGEANGVQFIAMRFVAGGTLQGIIRNSGALPPRRAAAFISQVASALDAAHAEGLVHRDVKPGNILVDARRGGPEHTYLTDFGIARAMLSAGTQTNAGQFLGTPDYAAPEQINGHPVDGRADQYALGCVAYEVLTGTVPFVREMPLAVLYAHLSTPVTQVTLVRPDLPLVVNDVLNAALAKVPGARYPSCADFADALREALGLDPYDPSKSARPPTTAVPARPPIAPTMPLIPPGAPREGKAASVAERGRGPGAAPEARPARAPASGQPARPGQAAGADRGAWPVQAPRAAAAATWTAVVTTDRAYYDSMSAVNEQDTASISFPGDLPERRIPLTGAEVRIGRRSVSKGIEPEIDLIGPPVDPGVSRQHAKLIPAPDGSWTVVDLGTVNGITVNGMEVPSGDSVPLRPGDRIHLGAWTKITITRG